MLTKEQQEALDQLDEIRNMCEEMRAINQELMDTAKAHKAEMEEKLVQSRIENARLLQEVCEWVCPRCENEYYGRSGLEVSTFNCLNPDCMSLGCVLKKFYQKSENLRRVSEKVRLIKVA